MKDEKEPDHDGPLTRYSWSVIILAFNEETSLAQVVASTCRALEDITAHFTILIVDDGSRDETGRIADTLCSEDARIQVIHHERNRGIGYGLLTGYAHAEGDIVGMIPADGQFDSKDLRAVASHVNDCDIVATYREHRNDSAFRMLVTAVNRIMVELLFGVSIRDVNWVKFYKQPVLKRVHIGSVSPLIESEIVIQAVKGGARMIEIPSSYLPRVGGRARGASFKHLFRSVLDLVKLYKRLRSATVSP